MPSITLTCSFHFWFNVINEVMLSFLLQTSERSSYCVVHGCDSFTRSLLPYSYLIKYHFISDVSSLLYYYKGAHCRISFSRKKHTFIHFSVTQSIWCILIMNHLVFVSAFSVYVFFYFILRQTVTETAWSN